MTKIQNEEGLNGLSEPVLGSEHTLVPHDLGVSGGGVARLAGMTVFLDGGLPGETARCRITERKARFAKAVVLETLAPSPHAAPSFCRHGGHCGGCAWTTFAYEAELAWKERRVRETLRRIGKVAFRDEGNGEGATFFPIIPSPRRMRYRNKMEFAFGFSDGGPDVGLRRRNSRAVVPIDDCALSAAPVDGVLAHARSWMRDAGLAPWDGKSGFLRFLVVRCPDYAKDGAKQFLAELITAPGNKAQNNLARVFGETLLASDLGVTGFAHSARAAKSDVAYGERVVARLGETTIHEKIGAVLLEAPVQSFLQANTEAAALLYELVQARAEEIGVKVIWDAYCGAGGLALSLAGAGRTVRGVDNVAEAAAFAAKNAEGLEGDIAFVHGDAARVLADADPAPELVVADPPRAGMSPEFVAALLRRKPGHVAAVSCDAASLARDLAALSPQYRVASVGAVDMFPHTPHVEIVAFLELRDA